VNVAAQAFLRTLSRVVGGEAIADAISFFQAFDGMEEGFRQRANAVAELLRSQETAYVLITAPRRDTVDEARYFAGRLAEGGTPAAAVIVNRVHPDFGGSRQTLAGGNRSAAMAELIENRAELQAVNDAEAAVLAPLRAQLGVVPVASVPLLPTDVHDLDGMAEIADHLFDRAPG
jgi:anion-transporting  ArsA/GET3 family ATPase